MCGLAIQSTSVLHSSSVSKQLEHPLLDHSGIINGCWMCSGLNILLYIYYYYFFLGLKPRP